VLETERTKWIATGGKKQHIALIFLASTIDSSGSEAKTGSGIGLYSKYRPKRP
jgi:hypothetical protein